MRIKKTGKGAVDTGLLAPKRKNTGKGTGRLLKRLRPPVLVIDSNYLGYQALFTTGQLEHDGVRTGVVFGFLHRILDLAVEFDTDRFIFCWDSRKSHRRDMFSGYKIRDENKTEEELEIRRDAYRQFDILRKQVLPEMGFGNVWHRKGYEADDLIAGVCQEGVVKGKTIIISADEDMFQLLRKGVCMYTPSSQKLRHMRWWTDHHRIEPKDWAMVKAIAGCTSDTVPGIVGVGEKKAEDYVEGILPEHFKAYKAIQEGQEIIERNLPLVKLPFEGLRLPKLRKNHLTKTKLNQVFNRFGFDSFYWDKDLWKKWIWLVFGANPDNKDKDIRWYRHPSKT